MSDLLDPKAFRRALGNFATGITVMTATGAAGERVGVTANSFNSVSLDPPLILWSIEKRSNSLAVFQQASHFAVNILAADQMHLSNNFARSSDDKFDGIEFDVGAGDAPLLHDCAAIFECERYEMLDGGDHWIMIGKVVSYSDIGRQPLCYHQGGYASVLPYSRFSAESESQKRSVKQIEGRLNNNFFYLMTQAARSYQNGYQPLQLAMGLQTNEARLLMVLDQHHKLTRSAMSTEVNLPESEIDAAAETLLRKGLVEREETSLLITLTGRSQADKLWQISEEEQNRVFSAFSKDELETFGRVLRAII